MDEKGKLVNSYSGLSVSDKRIELEKEIDEITLIMRELLTDLKPDTIIHNSKIFSDFPLEDVSEGEYLNYLYEDILNLKDILGKYCDFTTNLYYDSVDSIDIE